MAQYIRRKGWDDSNPSIDDVDLSVSNSGQGAHLTTLLSGEDQTNDVIRIESQQGYYVFDHGAATADETLGTTGAAGDLLVRVTVTEAGTSQPINIYDGTVAAGTLVLSIPTTAAIGTTYELGIVATTSAGWTVDDLADTTGIVVCVGRFT